MTIKFTEQASIRAGAAGAFRRAILGRTFSPGGVLKSIIMSTPEAVIDQINGLLRELSPEMAFLVFELVACQRHPIIRRKQCGDGFDLARDLIFCDSGLDNH